MFCQFSYTAQFTITVDPNEPIPEPRWLTWYTNQTDTNCIEPFNKWTDAYLEIEDRRGDPIWMEDYLGIQDEEPFILSQTQTFNETEIRSIDEIYCVDKSISGDDQTLQFCLRAWLDDKTNPYEDMTWYTDIQYPSSDMAPYNEACEFSACQEIWLENDLNPFSKDTNGGCYAFYDYCRGYEPSRYQCKVFWDFCRTEQDSRNPGWKYPRDTCKDADISSGYCVEDELQTCQFNSDCPVVGSCVEDRSKTCQENSDCPVTSTGQCSDIIQSVDIGANVDGSTTYEDGAWSLKGNGLIGSTSDNFHYSYVPASGEYVDTKILVQDFTGTQDNARAGIMIRESLEPNSRHYTTLLNGEEQVQGLYRTSTGDSSSFTDQSSFLQGPVWLRTIKDGSKMTSYYKRGNLAARKVRVTRPNTSNHLHMREVEVIDMNGDNVAYGKPAKQSSTLQDRAGYRPENAVDGNLNTLMQTEWEEGET